MMKPQCPDCTIDQVFYCPYERQRQYAQALADALAARLPVSAGMIHNGRIDQGTIDRCLWHEPIARARMARMIHDQTETDASRPEWQPSPTARRVIAEIDAS